MVVLQDMRRFIAGEFRLGEPLSRYSVFRVGGPADYFLRPASQEDFVGAVRYLRRSGIPFFIAAAGTNVLVSDQGYRGAALGADPGITHLHVERDGMTLCAGAGVRLARLVDFSIQRSLRGVEQLAGLNGSVGGALHEAAADRRPLVERLVSVEALRGDAVVTLAPGQEGDNQDIVLSVRLRMEPADQGELLRARRAVLLQRNRERPLNLPNSGCMFRDPEGDSAADLVQRAGMRGRVRGGAQVSEVHANLVTNGGNATADDILGLLREVRDAVKTACGVTLQPAVRLIGFDDVALGEVA